MAGLWRFLRTCRHFPAASLWHRLRLKGFRKLAQPVSLPPKLSEGIDWQAARRLQTFDHWRYQRQSPEVCEMTRQALHRGESSVLNRSFPLPQTLSELRELLQKESALQRENLGYLEFLQPLLHAPQVNAADIQLIQAQMRLFWQLSFSERTWSTYGVARRLLTYAACWSHLAAFPEDFRQELSGHLYGDTRFLIPFLEWDVKGNHLIKNLKAWLAAALLLETVPAASKEARNWLARLPKLLTQQVEAQLLSDGFHQERTPMYHLWVLIDMLDGIAWLSAFGKQKPDELMGLAQRMLAAMPAVVHSSGQPALFGDSSLPQTPHPAEVLAYAKQVLGSVEAPPAAPWQCMPQAGFAIFRHALPRASLILDFGDFGPTHLPAHSHSDMGSFEVHVNNTPLIVDGGITEYEAGPARDYCRSAAAHNTLWVPGEDQAETWGSFRVAEYPHAEPPEIESDPSGIKITLSYENHNHRYHHQRSVYGVQQDFWVIQDWVRHLQPAGRPCYSLLHIPTDVAVSIDQDIFTLNEQLLVIPFGARQLELSAGPLHGNLNRISAGFDLDQPGQLLAMTPKLDDCFGWVLVPFEGKKPIASRVSRLVSLEFEDTWPDGSPRPGKAYQLTWDSSGLSVAFRGPGDAPWQA